MIDLCTRIFGSKKKNKNKSPDTILVFDNVFSRVSVDNWTCFWFRTESENRSMYKIGVAHYGSNMVFQNRQTKTRHLIALNNV